MNRHPIVDEIVAHQLDAGLSQKDLARRTHRSARAISHFESDPGGRQLWVVDEIARGLGLRVVLVPIDDELAEAS